MDRRNALIALLGVPLLASCGTEESDTADIDSAEPPEEDDGMADYLFVMESGGVQFEGDTLTLIDMKPLTLYFTDRPQEYAGYLSFEELVAMVSEGPDSFPDDPPNATLVTLGGDDIDDVVVNLSTNPRQEGTNLVFPTVEIIQGDPMAHGGLSALFIDVVGRPLTPVSVAGAHRRHRRRRRRHHEKHRRRR